MEKDFFERFPHLGKGIFDYLDNEDIARCKETCKSWNVFINGEQFYWTRVIRFYIENIDEFKETWKMVMEKTNSEMIKELGLAVKYFLNCHPFQCKLRENCIHRAISYSPLHIGAEAGKVSLCRFILGRVEDKNPKAVEDSDWTPLHEAAQIGSLEICLMILDEINEKNPKLTNGTTPLHQAAKNGHLQVCQAIMDNIEDKNPKANDGWTPLHSAAWKGHFQVYQAIMDKVEDKNPEDYYGMTPLNLAESNGYTSIIYAIKWQMWKLNIMMSIVLFLICFGFFNYMLWDYLKPKHYLLMFFTGGLNPFCPFNIDDCFGLLQYFREFLRFKFESFLRKCWKIMQCLFLKAFTNKARP